MSKKKKSLLAKTLTALKKKLKESPKKKELKARAKAVPSFKVIIKKGKKGKKGKKKILTEEAALKAQKKALEKEVKIVTLKKKIKVLQRKKREREAERLTENLFFKKS